MRRIGSWLVICAVWGGAELACGQAGVDLPVSNRTVLILPPAIDGTGRRVAFGSAIPADGTVSSGADAYITSADGSGLRRLTNVKSVNAIALSSSGDRLAYTAVTATGAGGSEEVHVVDTATGTDRTVAVDREGCIQPLIACAFCFFSCVRTPHFSADGAKVVYAVSRNQPFRTMNADGTGGVALPVFSGGLAPAAQRVISANGTLVFTSAAPSGPTFAASATDVYAIGLDGSGLRNLTKFGLNSSIFSANAAISAPGDTVVFESNYNSPGGVSRIWMVRGDGSGLRQISGGDGAASSPSISGDGSLAAFAQDGQIWVARTDGKSAAVALTSFRVSSAQDAVLSDDGTRVAFSLGPRAGERGAIYTIASAGGDPRPVYAPPSIQADGVTNASPGSVMTVYGTNLAADAVVTAGQLPLPYNLAGVTALVDDSPIPLLALTPWQVNAQLPQETAAGTARLQLQFANGTATATIGVNVKNVAPELFFYAASGGQGGGFYQQAAAYHAGTAVAADVNNPAQAGETLETYGAGLGATSPIVAAGNAAPSPAARTVVTPQVRIGNLTAAVVFSGLVPGLIGVYQVNVIVPGGLRAGLQTIGWQVGQQGVISSSIAVR